MLIEWLKCVRVTGEATLLSLVKDKGRLYLSSLQIISKDDGKVCWRETRTSLGYNSNCNQAQRYRSFGTLGPLLSSNHSQAPDIPFMPEEQYVSGINNNRQPCT